MTLPFDQIAEQLTADINDYCVATYTDTPRKHLGASEIGDDCTRDLWYKFRWVKQEEFSGRMLRLFQRGKLEEIRIAEYLDGIGFQRRPTIEPKQIISLHFGGTTDGIGVIEKYFADPIILEYKTWNTKGFLNLKNNGSIVNILPKHYIQMCVYGRMYDIKYGLYIAINKNDDDIFLELLELNFDLADEYIQRGLDIIASQTPPPRISEQPSFYKCNYCARKEICHFGADYNINCRSCKFATPSQDGTWYCNFHLDTIPNDFILKACPSWSAIT